MKRLSRSSDSDDSGGETDCDRSEQRGTRQKDKKRQKSRSRTSARKGKAPAPPSNSRRSGANRLDDSLMDKISAEMSDIARIVEPTAPLLSSPETYDKLGTDVARSNPYRALARTVGGELDDYREDVLGARDRILTDTYKWLERNRNWEDGLLDSKLDEPPTEEIMGHRLRTKRLYDVKNSTGILSAVDKKYLRDYAGHFHAEKLDSFHRTKRASMTLTNIRLVENLVVPTRNDIPGQCTHCELVHGHENAKSDCSRWDSNGPRVLQYVLDVPDFQKQYYQAVAIGTSHLLFLPTYVRNVVLNLGCTRYPEYDPRSTGTNTLSIGPHSLVDQLRQRIKAVGKELSIPMFVEYTRTQNHWNKKWIDNLFGFFAAILEVQSEYQGQLVVVIPPFMPRSDKELENYENMKLKRENVGKVARFIGLRVGVPVWIIDVQSLRTEGDWYTLRQHWYREPLYNSKGEYTREYSRRLEFEFMEILKAYEVQMY